MSDSPIASGPEPKEQGLYIRRLQLLGSAATGKTYTVDFTDPSGAARGLFIVAGESQTGKTSVINYIRYCLGAKEYPQQTEMSVVRSALLEVELRGELWTIERSTSGAASSFASMWPTSIEGISEVGAGEERLLIEPTSDPRGLSQRILAALDLAGVALPVAPTQLESDVDVLSIRDALKLFWYPNERLDSKNLLFEREYTRHKFLQTLDALFGIDDSEGAALTLQLRLARSNLRTAESTARTVRQLVAKQYPSPSTILEAEIRQMEVSTLRLSEQLVRIDDEQKSGGVAISRLRDVLAASRVTANQARLRRKDRESFLNRLRALQAQYVDDQRKLVFQTEAERLFDPLMVSTCPACLADLTTLPSQKDGVCTLCGTQSEAAAEEDGPAEASPSHMQFISTELRATGRRLSEITSFIDRLSGELEGILRQLVAAERAEVEASNQLDAAVNLPAPFLATRQQLISELSDLRVGLDHARSGLSLWRAVEEADAEVDRHAGEVTRLQDLRGSSVVRPARNDVVAQLSKKFAQILEDIGYPKLSEPYIDGNYVPHVRGNRYSDASSGGMVLISLAWALSVWEVALSSGARPVAPLMIDSPQKNLGHRASPNDSEFGDSILISNFYRHIQEWLVSSGAAGQIIIVDNSPPPEVASSVTIRFSRDPEVPPYGLIDDAFS